MRHLQNELNKDKIGGKKPSNPLDMKETTGFLQCQFMPIATQSLEPDLSAGNERNPSPYGIFKSNLTLFVSSHKPTLCLKQSRPCSQLQYSKVITIP